MKTAGNNRKTTSNRVALYGLLIALAFVLSYVETLFPVYLGAPGVKLGLANLVTVIALYGLGVKEAFAINVVRVLLSGFTFGNMSSILFGMAGAVLSLFLMAVCKKLRLFGFRVILMNERHFFTGNTSRHQLLPHIIVDVECAIGFWCR